MTCQRHYITHILRLHSKYDYKLFKCLSQALLFLQNSIAIVKRILLRYILKDITYIRSSKQSLRLYKLTINYFSWLYSLLGYFEMKRLTQTEILTTLIFRCIRCDN